MPPTSRQKKRSADSIEVGGGKGRAAKRSCNAYVALSLCFVSFHVGGLSLMQRHCQQVFSLSQTEDQMFRNTTLRCLQEAQAILRIRCSGPEDSCYSRVRSFLLHNCQDACGLRKNVTGTSLICSKSWRDMKPVKAAKATRPMGAGRPARSKRVVNLTDPTMIV